MPSMDCIDEVQLSLPRLSYCCYCLYVYIYDDIDVMEERLYERYKDDINSPDTKRKYDSRCRQNAIDYREMPEHESVFYTFIRNCLQ